MFGTQSSLPSNLSCEQEKNLLQTKNNTYFLLLILCIIIIIISTSINLCFYTKFMNKYDKVKSNHVYQKVKLAAKSDNDI